MAPKRFRLRRRRAEAIIRSISDAIFSTSGNAWIVIERAQLKSIENSSLREYNKLCKSNYFCTESLVSGHNCSNRQQATPYFHFRFSAKCRQTRTAWVNGQTSYDHRILITVSSFLTKRRILHWIKLCTFEDQPGVTGSRNVALDVDRTIASARRFNAVGL